MHGKHFTFKSVVSNSAVTIVAPSVTGTFVSKEKPYVIQGPWLQVLLPVELAEKMAEEFEVLSTPNEVKSRRERCPLSRLYNINAKKKKEKKSYTFNFNPSVSYRVAGTQTKIQDSIFVS